MTSTRFRILLVVSTALFIAAALADDLVPPVFSEELAAAYAKKEAWVDTNFWPAVALAVLLGGSTVAGLIGLFFFQRWGRSLSLCSSIGVFVVYPALGPSLTSPLAGALDEASSLLWGAILALAYYSQVSDRFGKVASVVKAP